MLLGDMEKDLNYFRLNPSEYKFSLYFMVIFCLIIFIGVIEI